MFDNYFFLRRLVLELEKELKDLIFYKSVSQSKNEIRTGFFHKDVEKSLVFTFQKLPPLIYLKDEFSFAKKNYVEFFEILKDKTLDKISIDEYERNIRLMFGEFQLIFLFRGNHSNVVLINSKNEIVDSFKKPKEILGKSFYHVFPHSDLDLSYFKDELKFDFLFESDFAERKKYFRILGNFLTEEIKFRAEQFNKNYFQIFKELQEEFNYYPLHIYEDNLPSFCHFKHLNLKYHYSKDLFSDLNRIYFSNQKTEDLQHLKAKILKKVKSDYEYHFKKLQDLRKPENFIDRSEEFRQIGNLILMNANQLKKGEKNFTLEFEGREYKIKLDPIKTPFENAEMYFEMAREEASRLNSLNTLIKKEERELEKLKEIIDEVENSLDKKSLMKFMDEQKQQLKEQEITRYFRHFVIDGKYDVFVGKDSKSNDLLTIEFAKSDDLWFHARGVSGSHLILRRSNKNETIPKNVIEKAASIAAYYSKAKNSKLVPVSYTEKKYVIKRKGMTVGTVQLQREKVIMVEPKIPEKSVEE